MTAPADQLQIDRQAAVERIPLAPTSWVDFVPAFVRDAEAAFTELHDTVAWTQTEVLRYDKYVPENRLGAGVRNEAFPLLRQTDLHLTSRYRVPFAGVRRSCIGTVATSRACTAIASCAGSTTPSSPSSCSARAGRSCCAHVSSAECPSSGSRREPDPTT